MEKEIERIVKRISEIDVTQGADVLGDIISDILFKKGYSALYIEHNPMMVELLLPVADNGTIKTTKMLQLTEMVAVLEFLEQNRLIYVVDDAHLDNYLFYSEKQMFDKEQRPDFFIIADGLTFQRPKDGRESIARNGMNIMCGVEIPSQIGKSLAKFLCSPVLPTKSLKEYVGRGYKTKEERYTQLGLRYSIISVTIAVLVAAVSPFASVIISNRMGISTLNHQQMDSLVNKPRPIYIKLKNLPCDNNGLDVDGKNVSNKQGYGKK